MRSPEQLREIMDRVCADVRDQAVGATEVAERLVVVTGGVGAVPNSTGIDVFTDGSLVAFINDSGVPFAEQSDKLVAQARRLKPEAVLLAGSALTGRPGGTFRRVLAVQLFTPKPEARTAMIAAVSPPEGPIRTVGPWRRVKAGPLTWADRVFE